MKKKLYKIIWREQAPLRCDICEPEEEREFFTFTRRDAEECLRKELTELAEGIENDYLDEKRLNPDTTRTLRSINFYEKCYQPPVFSISLAEGRNIGDILRDIEDADLSRVNVVLLEYIEFVTETYVIEEQESAEPGDGNPIYVHCLIDSDGLALAEQAAARICGKKGEDAKDVVEEIGRLFDLDLYGKDEDGTPLHFPVDFTSNFTPDDVTNTENNLTDFYGMDADTARMAVAAVCSIVFETLPYCPMA